MHPDIPDDHRFAPPAAAAHHGSARHGPVHHDPAHHDPAHYGPGQHGPGHGYPLSAAPWGAPLAGWPSGPGRPGVATAAAVLGFVTGGLTLLGSLVMAVAVGSDGADLPTVVLLLGFPCGAGLIAGAALLLNRRQPWALLVSALAAIAVLVTALIGGAATLSADDALGQFVFTLLALPLPTVTAALTGQRRVLGWAEAAPR